MSISRQHEDGTLTPVEADSSSEDLRVRCVAAIEEYQAEHSTAPNGLVIETTGHIIATYDSGWESSPPVAVGIAIIGPIRTVVAIGMIIPMRTVMIVTVRTDDHHRR